MGFLYCLVCFTLAMATAGCLYIPTPQHDLLYGRGMVDEETTQGFRNDITTCEHVLLLLGEPDATLRNQSVFIYTWTRKRGYFVAAGGYGSGYAADIHKTTILLIEFDESNCLKRFEYISNGLFSGTTSSCLFYKSVMDRAEEWIPRTTVKDISTQEK